MELRLPPYMPTWGQASSCKVFQAKVEQQHTKGLRRGGQKWRLKTQYARNKVIQPTRTRYVVLTYILTAASENIKLKLKTNTTCSAHAHPFFFWLELPKLLPARLIH